MAEADQELSTHTINENAEIIINTTSSFSCCLTQHKWWLIQSLVYAVFVLAGESGGTLLGQVYFVNGGKSEWLVTLVQVVGFPILFPFRLLTNTNTEDRIRETNIATKHIASFYVSIGVLDAASCMLYSIGLRYLPVTTYTLLCASQLGFSAVFSYFLNKQKFTPYIVNSIVLLTFSSLLLVLQTDPGNSNKASDKKYAIGFSCTLAGSAGHALILSLTQVAFQRIIKKETLRAAIDLTIYQGLVATLVILIGLFASGDWRRLTGEMRDYKSRGESYVMNLVWAAVSWQALTVGCVGLIFKVSSLFSNLINILGLSVPPVMAVIFLKEKLTGLKVMALSLAMWGFASYMYQHFVEDVKKNDQSVTFSDHNEQGLESHI